MNHMQAILKAIRRIRRRLLMNRVIRCSVRFGVAGTLPGLAVLMLSLWIPLYYAVPLALAMGLMGLFAGACYGAATRPLLSQAALAADRAGLDEHLVTALEFQDSNRIFHGLQREQAARKLERFDIKAAFPIKVPAKECLAFMLAVCLCAAAALVPAAAKDAARERYAVRKQVGEEAAKIEKVLEAVENKAETPELSDDRRDDLAGLLNEALEEMKGVGSIDELEKSKDRLGKKLEIAAEKEDDLDFGDITEKIAGELGLSERKGERRNSSGVEEKVRGAIEGWNSSLTEEELEELAKSLSERLLDGTLTGTEIAEAAKMLDIDEETLREALGRIAEEAALAEGSPEKGRDGGEDGVELGEGAQGALVSEGQSGLNLPGGQGYDTGGKTGFEKDDSAFKPAEELEIPGRVTGDDENLTGTETQGRSYFVETEDGLAWSGRKVDYGQVVGEYAAEAEKRINRSEVPRDMREIVRDYFSGLTG